MAVNKSDKYFTPINIVDHVIKKTIEIIGVENITEIIESSAGKGVFIEPLKKAFPNITQHYYELIPESNGHPEIVKMNFMRLMLTYLRNTHQNLKLKKSKK